MDPRDFEQLVARYQGVVCAVAYAVVRDRARSEEIAQEAFLIAWQKLPAMDPPPTLPAWVCGIARNLAANARRRRKETAMDNVPETAATGTPLDHMLDHERADLANRALARLSESDREAVVLYYRGDGSIADVATTLGITEPAARQRLHRGRERLASALQSVEAALRSTRPGPAFTAACVTAALAVPSGDAAAATVPKAPRRWLPIAGAAIVAVAALSVVAVVRLAPSAPPPESSPTLPTVAGLASSVETKDAAVRSRASGVVVKHLDASARATLADKIRDARAGAKRIAPTGSANGAELDADRVKIYDFSGDTLGPIKQTAPPKTKILDKANIRWAIREIQPLLLECYTAAQPRLPKGGTLEVQMTVVGEPDLGTIVDAIEFGGSPHLAGDRDFAECMRETLFAIELPPLPSPNETWRINYPFTMPK